MALTYEEATNSIYINNDIEMDMVAPLLEFKDKYIKKVSTLKTPPPITVHVNTYGGSAYGCFAIVDILEELCELTTVKTIGYGAIMSAGIPIWLSGNVREARPRATFMIHQVISFMWGSVDKIKDDLEVTERLNDIYIKVITDKTKLTKRELKKFSDKKKDYYLDSEEMMGLLKLTEKEKELDK